MNKKTKQVNAVFKSKLYFFEWHQKRRHDSFLQSSKHATQFYIDLIWTHLNSLIKQEVHIKNLNNINKNNEQLNNVLNISEKELKDIHSKIIKGFKAADYLTAEYLDKLIRIEKLNKEFKKYNQNKEEYLKSNPNFLQSDLYLNSCYHKNKINNPQNNNNDNNKSISKINKTSKTRLGNRSASQCLKKAIEMIEGTLKNVNINNFFIAINHHYKKI